MKIGTVSDILYSRQVGTHLLIIPSMPPSIPDFLDRDHLMQQNKSLSQIILTTENTDRSQECIGLEIFDTFDLVILTGVSKL